MFKFISIRLIQFPLILAVIYLATFMLAWVAPGDPLQRTERPLSAQARKMLEEKYHIENTWTFLSHYPFQMLKGDFGPSFSSDSLTVGQIIKHGLPVSMGIGLLAMLIAVTCGVSIGTVAAVARGKVFDWLSISIALIGVSVPSFVIAVGLRTAFAYHIDAFPAGNWPAGIERNLLGGPFTGFKWMLDEQGSHWIAGDRGDNFSAWLSMFPRWLYHAFLPALALSLLPMAYITRLTRVSMIDVLGADYVRTARAKGLSKPKVVIKHCLRNALLPVLSYIGPATAATMVGSFVVETVFAIPGLGRDFVASVTSRDQTMILGTVMVYSSLLLTLNLIVDISYVMVDPRIDVNAKKA